MIESLNQINTALVKLSQQLSNKQTTNQTIRKCIHNLVEQVKFLDQKQRYNYYLLISQIYSTRFQNIQDATAQLKQFSKTLDSEISMNCQLRIAFFHYFQMNYKQAFKHLDIALGQVEEELKLIDNAKFFFNRVLNKEYLVSQSKDKLNFQSGFMLSLIYEHEKEYILALKQIQSFIDHCNDSFIKFQIYKKLLELYETMKKNAISTISVSKKSIQTYRQDLQTLQNTYPHFQENFHYKCKFVNRVINFVNSGETKTNEKLAKKMLDFKLMAYYKLKKCCKQAPSRNIKDALQDTAKLIKTSKSTELLENILNYDFIKQQYETFKVFYKPCIIKKLYNIKFFSSLCNYEPGNILSVSDQPQFIQPQSNTMLQKSLFSKKSKKPQYEPEYQYPPPLYSTKFTPNEQQPNLFSFKPNNTALKRTAQTPKPPKQTKVQIKQTESQIVKFDDFEGSKMYKFNSTSSGHEERYFYIIPQTLSDKPKLYYCMSKNSKSSSDSYYSLKGLKKIVVGKKTETLMRKEAQKYSDTQCFALFFEDGKDRSFYVPNEDDLQKWVLLLQTKVLYTDSNIDKMTRTMGFKQDESRKNMNRTSPPLKKTKIKFDI